MGRGCTAACCPGITVSIARRQASIIVGYLCPERSSTATPADVAKCSRPRGRGRAGRRRRVRAGPRTRAWFRMVRFPSVARERRAPFLQPRIVVRGIPVARAIAQSFRPDEIRRWTVSNSSLERMLASAERTWAPIPTIRSHWRSGSIYFAAGVAQLADARSLGVRVRKNVGSSPPPALMYLVGVDFNPGCRQDRVSRRR